jgi:hypothetical protein
VLVRGTSLQPNRLQMKLTADAGNVCCYVHIPITYIRSVHSSVEVPLFQKESTLETSVSCERRLRNFREER